MSRLLLILMLTVLLAGNAGAIDPSAYIINTSGETLSKINLETGGVTNDILVLGSDILSYPNQIIVRDTMAYVVLSGTAEIQRINLNTETTVDFISTGGGSNPFWMEFYDSRYAFASLWVNGTLIKIDFETGAVADTWPIGVSPEGVLIHDHKAYVAISALDQSTWDYGQGRVAVFDIRGDSLIGSIDVGLNPQYIARDSQGRLHVVCTGDYWSAFGMVYVVDPDLKEVVDSLSVGGSPGLLTITSDDIGFIAAGGWASDGYVYTYDAELLDPLHSSVDPLVVDSGCMMVVAFQDGSCFTGSFKDFVKPIDTAGTTLATYAVGDGPVHADFNYQPGDINGDFSPADIADLVYLVSYMFQQGPELPQPRWRANVNGDFVGPDIGDLVYLVSYMFQQGDPLQMPPIWPVL